MKGLMNKLDDITNSWCEEKGFEHVLVRYRIREVRKHARGSQLLDLGCGVGFLCRAMADKMSVIIGVDGSSRKIERARQVTKCDNITYVHSLFEVFEPAGVFDTVVMSNVLEHVEDPVTVLQRATEWLTSNGIVIVIVPNALALHKRIGRYMGLIDDFYALTPADKSKGHRRIYDAENLRGDIEGAGLVVTKLSGLFLKPLSNVQMESFGEDLCDALYEVGRELPEYCSSLFACAKKE